MEEAHARHTHTHTTSRSGPGFGEHPCSRIPNPGRTIRRAHARFGAIDRWLCRGCPRSGDIGRGSSQTCRRTGHGHCEFRGGAGAGECRVCTRRPDTAFRLGVCGAGDGGCHADGIRWSRAVARRVALLSHRGNAIRRGSAIRHDLALSDCAATDSAAVRAGSGAERAACRHGRCGVCGRGTGAPGPSRYRMGARGLGDHGRRVCGRQGSATCGLGRLRGRRVGGLRGRRVGRLRGSGFDRGTDAARARRVRSPRWSSGT